MRALFLAAVLLAISGGAFATDCLQPKTPYDTTYCAALKMVQRDRVLTEQYQRTLFMLSADQKKTLIRAQNEWTIQRDMQCTQGKVLRLNCVNDKMARRITLLQQIEHACHNARCETAPLNQID